MRKIMRHRVAFLTCGVLVYSVAAACLEGPTRGADLGLTAPVDGVACDGAQATAFASVWLGHFSGGYSHGLGPGLPIVLDWRDEKLCFPTRHSCDRYMRVMRHEFHRPEGYFTCLPIR